MRDSAPLVMKPWRPPEIEDISITTHSCFRCVLLLTSTLKKEAIVSLLVGMFCMLAAADLAGVAMVTGRVAWSKPAIRQPRSRKSFLPSAVSFWNSAPSLQPLELFHDLVLFLFLCFCKYTS